MAFEPVSGADQAIVARVVAEMGLLDAVLRISCQRTGQFVYNQVKLIPKLGLGQQVEGGHATSWDLAARAACRRAQAEWTTEEDQALGHFEERWEA